MINLILNEQPSPVAAESARRSQEACEGDALTRYLAQAALHARLDAAEELALGRRILAGRQADGELTADAAEAVQKLAAANLRLVHHVAASFAPRREEMPELLSAGNVGLMKSARDFDPRFGHRFSTYAFWNIRSHILREMYGRHRAVHLPRNIHEKLSRLRQEEARLTQQFGRAPSDEELAAALAVTPEKLAELRAHRHHGVSLDAPLGNEEEGAATLGDLLADEDAESPAESAARASDRELVHRLLRGLTPREAEVLRLRQGLAGPALTFDEIGRRLKVSRERVRQIESGALKKLKDQARS